MVYKKWDQNHEIHDLFYDSFDIYGSDSLSSDIETDPMILTTTNKTNNLVNTTQEVIDESVETLDETSVLARIRQLDTQLNDNKLKQKHLSDHINKLLDVLHDLKSNNTNNML